MKSEALFLIKKGAAEQAFERRTFELPKLEPNELLVESEAFGLNYADVMARNGLYREAPPMPCVVGYEVVGKVMVVASVPLRDKELLAVNVLPSATVNVEPVAGGVIVSLFTLVAVATPISGVTRVGEVSTTNLVPVPV